MLMAISPKCLDGEGYIEAGSIAEGASDADGHSKSPFVPPRLIPSNRSLTGYDALLQLLGEAMRRRDVIKLLSGLLGGGAAAWPLAAPAQQSDRTRRIGMLIGWADSDPPTQALVAAVRDRLTNLGWTEGRNLRTELRWGNGDETRIEAFAKELVALGPHAIVGQTTPVIRALARETQSIPIVFVQVSDPIGSGFVASLAHPAGNMTGFTTDNAAQGGKWVELLKEIAPNTARVSVLFNPETAPPSKFFMPSIDAAASSFAIQASVAPVHTTGEIENVIAAQARSPGGGVIVTPDPFNVANRDFIIAQAARYRVPAIYFNRSFADSGGLIVYGDVFTEQFHGAAEYVDRILRGAKPADLPVQAPTKFELIVNLRTAKALGLAVAPTLLSRADEVIE
jgi:putative ABC transport system substrate-binding protein